MINNKNNLNILKSFKNRSIGGIALSEVLIKLGLVLCLVVAIPLMFPSGRSFKYSDLTEGSIASKKVIAPFTFSVLKTEDALAAERRIAQDQVPYYFSYADSTNQNSLNKLTQVLKYLEEFPSISTIKAPESPIAHPNDSIRTDNLLTPALSAVQEIKNRYQINLSKQEIDRLRSIATEKSFSSIKSRLISRFKSLISYKYIDIGKKAILNNKAVIITEGIEEDILIGTLYDHESIEPIIYNKFTNFENAKLYNALIREIFKPNVTFNDDLTQLRRREAIAAVPPGKDLVYENERIVDANERITKDIYQKLISLEFAMAEQSDEQGDWRNILSRLGKYLLTALILLLYIIYLSANRTKVYRDNKKLLLITILIFLQVGVGALIVGPLGWSSYIVPTTISSMLLGILFDPGIGFVGTVVIGLLLAGITGFDYTFAILTIFVGLVAIYSVTHIRTRNQIFKAILYILSAYIIVVFTMGTLKYQDFSEMFQIFLYYLLPNAILSPVITYMILGVFERLFDITTDVTLLELSDLNHPLLKELSVKAPGTFHHSIIVGNLSESAAITIGANSLMARVGSYYHDIGKMVKPEYFVENQKDKSNKHEGLAPNMSAIILASHVKNGLEMAEKNKIPKLIRDFIPEHHGKNLMSYFYNKAIEESKSKDIQESDYRYPGPSPQSKETAIVMLADTVEAATKTLSNPSAGRLRKLVEELVEKRFLEGELDDSDLTMRDLKGIIDGFMSVLLGIFHQRIEYPKSDESEKTNNKSNAKKGKPTNSKENESRGSQAS